MFDLDPNHSQFFGFFNRSRSLGDHTSLVYRAVRLFNRALSRDFDCDFNPFDSRLRDRWQSIAIACLHNTGLKPVELIQLDDCCFVSEPQPIC